MAGEATNLLAKIAAGLTARIGGAPALELLQELATGGRQLELAQCCAAEQIDRSGIWQTAGTGCSSTVSFLKKQTGESGGWVGRRVRLGRALEDALPATRQVWADGQIGMDKAAEIMRAVEGLDEESTADVDQHLAAAAPVSTLAALRGAADQLRSLADPDTAERRARADHLRQSFTLSQTTGGWYLTGWLNTEAGTIIHNALQTLLPQPAPAGTDEPRLTAKTRRALALIDMAQAALAHNACQSDTPARPTVVVTLAWDDLKHQLGVGDIEGAATIPAAAVRRLACDANILPIILGADSAVLDAGRSRRTVTPMQRAVLNLRDKGCIFPDCDRPPAWCQAHHIREWTKDHGPTDLDNLILLCHHHHHLARVGGWSITGTATRGLRSHPPSTGRPPFRPPTNPVRRT